MRLPVLRSRLRSIDEEDEGYSPAPQDLFPDGEEQRSIASSEEWLLSEHSATRTSFLGGLDHDGSTHSTTSSLFDEAAVAQSLIDGNDQDLNAVIAAESHQIFKDIPLDLNKRSVRFVEVLPDLSEDGLIQCTLSHGTVEDDEYVCLSYVWGSSKDIQQIMINGEQFPAQKNLWTFLSAARHAHQYPATTRRLYWIDALCIDQGNIKERNHQVGHMGAVYAAARHVVIWMGVNEAISRLLDVSARFSEFIAPGSSDEEEVQFAEIWRQSAEAEDVTFVEDWQTFASNSYWSRAWITQEVLFARGASIMTDKIRARSDQLKPLFFLRSILPLDFLNVEPGEDVNQLTIRSFKYLESIIWPMAQTKRRKMINLFNEYPRRESQLVRDRLYSLISLSSDAESIPVDYAISDRTFFAKVVVALHDTMNCMCSVALAANTLHYAATGGIVKAGEEEPLFKLTAYHSGSDDVWMLPETRRICSICRESISAESYPTFCLKNICAKMRGHLVLETGITPGGPENMTSLRLEIRGRRHNVEFSRTVPWLRRDIRTFDIWFGVGELLYLVRTASGGTTHAGENLCSQGLQGKGYLGLCNERRQLSVSSFGVRERNTDFISITTAAGESTETLRVFA